MGQHAQRGDGEGLGYHGGAYEDDSATVLSGTAAVDGDVISLPKLSRLTAGKKYRLEVRFTAGGNVFEAWGEVLGEQ